MAQRHRRAPVRVEFEPKEIYESGVPSIGHGQPMQIVPTKAATFESDGVFYWTDRIVSFQASFLKAHFVNVNLRLGDSLTLRDASGRVIETITGRGPKELGTFWALSSFGDELSLEFMFDEPYEYLPFEIDQVIVGEEELFDRPPLAESICNAEDFDDAICSQADADKWDNVLASVGVMTVGGNPATALFCSGANVSPFNYVLTNDHCIGSQATCDNSEFVFRYYRTDCNVGAPATTNWQTFRCDNIVASSPFGGECEATLSLLDFALCSVIGSPASAFGFVEPDPTPLVDGENIYIVQHPDGRPHEITEGGGGFVDVDGTVLRYYGTLDTESGSSGAPIFRNSDDLMVGLHHCGGCSTPGTGNRGMLMSDIYPSISSFLCSATPDIQATGVSPHEEVVGNGDLILDPGEIWQFKPEATNLACSAVAMDVTARVKKGPTGAPVIMLQDMVQFGDIAGGDRVVALNPVVFMVREYADCGSTILLDLVDGTSSNAGSFSDSIGIFSGDLGGDPTFTPFFDDFSGRGGPWSIVDGGIGVGGASTWTTTNPGSRVLPLLEPFYIVDADANGTSSMDEELISPLLDFSSFTNVELQFAHDLNWYSGGADEQADVDIRSSATGGAWVNIVNYSGADTSGTVIFDVSAQAGGQSDVQVRFHYYNAASEWWWAVDDVVFTASSGYSCNPRPEIPKKVTTIEAFR